jgi:hypothetical protein
MPQTYTPIASQTLTSAQANVTFSSIPSSYTDLILVCSAALASGTNDMQFQFNSDTGSNYSATALAGSGSSAISTRFTSQTYGYADWYGQLNTTMGSSTQIIQIMNYSNTTTFKTTISRANQAAVGVDAIVNLWRSTAAINSIKLFNASINIATGSTFTLYGILKA